MHLFPLKDMQPLRRILSTDECLAEFCHVPLPRALPGRWQQLFGLSLGKGQEKPLQNVLFSMTLMTFSQRVVFRRVGV